MSRKSNCDKTGPIEIEKEFKHRVDLTVVPSTITFDTMSFLKISLGLSRSSIQNESKRTLKRIYANVEQKNETESLIPHIVDDIWIKIFSHLDISTLTHMMISCKKMAHLANNDGIRKRLYTSKQDHLLNAPLKSTAFKFFVGRPELMSLPQRFSLHETATVIHELPQQIYNDKPPGKGFVMIASSI